MAAEISHGDRDASKMRPRNETDCERNNQAAAAAVDATAVVVNSSSFVHYWRWRVDGSSRGAGLNPSAYKWWGLCYFTYLLPPASANTLMCSMFPLDTCQSVDKENQNRGQQLARWRRACLDCSDFVVTEYVCSLVVEATFYEFTIVFPSLKRHMV
jgi:hypothetical protein